VFESIIESYLLRDFPRVREIVRIEEMFELLEVELWRVQ